MKSVKNECLSKLILFGEISLRRALREYIAHYHAERNHQGKDNVLLFPTATKVTDHGGSSVDCKERLGGLLKYYHRDAHECAAHTVMATLKLPLEDDGRPVSHRS